MIRIKEGKEKNLLRHHPWVFSGAMEEPLPQKAGIERVETFDGRFIAWGFYDPESHIQLRLASWDEKEIPDATWWARMVRQAVLRRKAFFVPSSDTNTFRLIHGEADFLPGVTADVYARIIRVIISSRTAFEYRGTVVDTLCSLLKPEMIILNTDQAFCGIEHMKEVTEFYKAAEEGEVVSFSPQKALDEIRIRESGIYYSLVPGSGQKSGFFCDQRENRLRVAHYAKDAVVFDGCCYTGSFTLHALRAGAKRVDAFDISSDAVHRLLSNVHLNEDLGVLEKGSHERVQARKGDIFEVLRTIPSNTYDLMILDPPKLAKTSKGLEEAKKGYKDLNRLAMGKIKNGGVLVTCSCSGSLSREDFRTVLAWSAKDAGVEVQVLETLGQGEDHPIRLSFPESEYLKVFILRVIR